LDSFVKPSISVIIPVFNRGWQLERALESLANQSYKHFEVVVCDDGSDEDIAPLVEAFRSRLPEILLIKISNSGGPARPRNIGVGAAHAEWIALLDSDDWWDDNRLEVISKNLTGSSEIIYHKLSVVREREISRFGEKRSEIGQEMNADPLQYMALFGNPIPASSVVIKKSLYMKLGGMREDPDFVAVEDFLMWLRAAQNGTQFKFIEQVLGSYWVGNDSISSVSLHQINAQKIIFQFLISLIPSRLQELAASCHNYRIGSMYLKLKDGHQSFLHLKSASLLPTFYLRAGRIVKLFIASVVIIKSKVIYSINSK
jgi:glycosyltransferase involved in cell wall biosynthesis